MTIPYFARLLCLSLAAFFVAHLVLTAMVRLVAALVIERSRRMRAGDGATLLFGLRIAPAALAAAVVVGLCAPSYLWLEPDMATEQIGVVCIAAAAIAAAAWIGGIMRAFRASVRSARLLRNCERVIESEAPVLMLAGVFHGRLIVSRGVRLALTSEQLAVAVRHERAHGVARDNLKRLLILLAPDAFPFAGGLQQLERAWSRMAEWAADDYAVDGSRQRSLSLASALVRVARLGVPAAAPLATPLLGNRDDLSVRIERLLNGGMAGGPGKSWPVIVVAIAIAGAAMQPASLVAVHRLLETLAH